MYPIVYYIKEQNANLADKMRISELQNIKQRYNIVGNCSALNHALNVALQVASTDLSVLIAGESGVGKEILPRLIHDNSPRHKGKYFAINCGSIPEGTIDSELFGHIKGSFTGAIGESLGYFGVANKGTLFLDEVGELPQATQARLLRVLETGEYIPVGATEVKKTDVRIVAATNVNLQKAISEGRFREDLFYRLNSIPIQMPSLRERGEDIVLLFRLFALQMAEKYHMEKITLTEDAKEILKKYKWPGNVRQLKNITEQISILCKERIITREILLDFIPQDNSTTLPAITNTGRNYNYDNEREILYKILFELRGNVNDLRRELSALKKQIEGTTTQHGVQEELFLQEDEINNIDIAKPVYLKHQAKKVVEEMPLVEEYTEHLDDLNLNLSEINRQMVQKALAKNNGNRKKAAQELGISDRTLYRKIKQYGME